MKKVVGVLMLALLLTSSVFAKKKVESYTFDFSKDFYVGVGYVVLNGSAFKESYFTKADVFKNEYTIEKVSCSAALVPIYLTLKVSLQQDGSLAYEYSDLRYKKDGSKTEMTALVRVNTITDNFDTLLPVVFGNESLYDQTKSKFFSEPGMLQAMTNGLTEIRAAKFSEMVKDAPINIPATVIEAKMNENDAYSDYKYYITASVNVSLTRFIYFVYYTNDDDKAALAKGDNLKISGRIDNFSKSKYLSDGLSFSVVDKE